MGVHLLLVRQAATAWTRTGRVEGGTPLPPEPDELEAIRAIVPELETFDPEGIYAPPVDPGRATGRALRQAMGLPLWFRPELAPLDTGAWEGLLWDEVRLRHARALRRWRADPRVFAPPMGETTAEVAARLRPLADDLIEGGAGGIVVADARVLDTLVRELLPGADPEERLLPDAPDGQACWTDVEVIVHGD
ncbi:MAG: histidine phosphatase family protein [Planctomycetota bacterium]